MDRSPTAKDTLLQMLAGYWISQAVHVAAELGIADLLTAGARGVNDLAAKTGADCDALYRVLRALASVGIFEEQGPGRFALTPMASLLGSDGPDSQRAFARIMGAEHYAAWGNLLTTVQTGEPAFTRTFGMPFFEYLARNPERGHLFDQSMTGVHGGETAPMLEAYDFSGFDTVVDVGGGNGLLLASLLERHPRPTGIVFDTPAVAEHARATLARTSLDGRCRIEAGDFFEAVPAGGDAYILRHILHDWEDAEAAAILRNCGQAMQPDGRVLVVENVIRPGSEPGFGKWLDLMMLVIGGRERTAEQYEALFSHAGLRLSRIVPTAHEISILEAVPLS
jgi:SAM-dependent methyltransferase